MDEITDKGAGKVHTEALERFDRAQEYERENRRLAEEDFLFVAGDGQWDYEIRKARESEGRPCLTMNRLPVYIAQVMGDARQNKPAIKIHPVDDKADIETAEIIEGIIRHIESDSDADVAYLTALQHACEGGFGHWRVITDYADDSSFDQDIKIQRIANPFSVYWDNNATHVNKADAEWCFVTEWMTTEAFDRKYPKAKDEVRDWEADHTLSRYGTWLDGQHRVRVAEYWCKKRKPITLSQLADGSVVEGKSELAVRTRESSKVEIYRYVLSGDRVLEGPELWPGKYIPIVSIYGPEEFIDNRTRYRSMIRHAKDAQRMYNYWQTAITEKIALAPKSPFTGTVEMFKGLEHIWNKANTLNVPFIPYNPDPKAPGARPERSRPADVNVAEIGQANQSIDDLKATIGIFDASLGAQGNETSGRAILARQREGDTATFAWIDNLARGIEHTGRILVDLIPRIYDTQRVIRILGEDDSENMVTINEMNVVNPWTGDYEILNDMTVGKYDVRVSVGPSFATRRVESAESMMAFIQAFPAAAPIAGDLIAKAMDWPGAEEIAERLKKTIPPEILDEDLSPEEMQQKQSQMAQQQQMEMEAYELEKADKMADVAQKQAETEEILAGIQKSLFELQQKAESSEAETDGQHLENLKSQLELAAMTGDLDALVEQRVRQVLESMYIQ